MTDIFADNCPVVKSFSNRYCEFGDNGNGWYTEEFIGIGSRCFYGTLGSVGAYTNDRFLCLKNRVRSMI